MYFHRTGRQVTVYGWNRVTSICRGVDGLPDHRRGGCCPRGAGGRQGFLTPPFPESSASVRELQTR